jgi:cob(I)alamin adenosyltransferase
LPKEGATLPPRRGDKGYTSLYSGERIPKYDLRPIAYGTLDEANSILGAAKATCKDEEFRRTLESLQKELFLVGAELAACPDGVRILKERLGKQHVQKLEEKIQGIEDNIEVPNAFIIPGSTLTSAFLDIARTVIRRAERVATKLRHQNFLDNEQVTIYLNRLSDLLFLLARYYERAISHVESQLAGEEWEDAEIAPAGVGTFW